MGKKIFRYFIYAISGIALIAVLAISYLFLAFPNVNAAPALTVTPTPERIERGKYLANHVSGCIDCHSIRDFKKFLGPLVIDTEGKGGEIFPEEFGVPGTLYSKNITPAVIGTMTDGELFRAITSGVRKNGDPLFPLMPYPNFNKMSEEDLYSIIAYIRTLKPIENHVQDSHIKFPMNLIIRTVPQNYTKQSAPDTSDIFAYGKYMITIASCGECHTQQVKGNPVEGMEFAGGFEFKTPMGMIRSANITPDEETGIGTWTKEQFIARFKMYATPEASNINQDTMKYATLMPWTFFAGMTEKDLGAIYTHLITLKPVHHKVTRFEPPEASSK